MNVYTVPKVLALRIATLAIITLVVGANNSQISHINSGLNRLLFVMNTLIDTYL